MASKINADEFVDREGEDKPTLPKGVVLSGVTTITTAVVAENEVANSTGINVGIITSTHFKGNLTGDVNAGMVTVTSQTVVGGAVTISASGIDIGAGVITATSYVGNGINLTGIGATIMIWEYNPDPSDMGVPFATGIGITFNQKIKAGSGNITLRKDSSSGTVVENFGIGSSVTIAGNSLTIDPTSDLEESQVYHLSYPSGVITNMAGDNYVGTAYTFKSLAYDYQLWMWGKNSGGELGHNDTIKKSSPVQIPGTTWRYVCTDINSTMAIKTDGTLWSWGYNDYGSMGQNVPPSTKYSSPVQVGSGTNWKAETLLVVYDSGYACKTDGTLWSWGYNSYGKLGLNDTANRSAPIQIGTATDWKKPVRTHMQSAGGIKTDGTLWAWGLNAAGQLGQNSQTQYSSPVQVPGTTWAWGNSGSYNNMIVTKTDGTMYAWGEGRYGILANNLVHNTDYRSSPVQIPGTTWGTTHGSISGSKFAVSSIKSDNTLWVWGTNYQGALGLNQGGMPMYQGYSSPVQIPGTTWSSVRSLNYNNMMIKTDGTLWSTGSNTYGQLGQNQGTNAHKSSPTQIPGTTWYTDGWNTGPLNAFHIGVIKRITP